MQTHQTLLLFVVSITTSSCCLHRAVAQTTTSTAVRGDGKRFVTYSFPSFANALLHLQANLTVLNNASISQGALQITPDSSNSADGYLVNQTGRVFFSSPFTLWSPSSPAGGNGTYVASFSMVFRVNIFRTNNSVPGEGIALVVASVIDPPPPGSYGGFLGLTNASTDGDPANRFVALELDTVKQPYDLDDNHVGLDVNGVRSLRAVPLAPFGIKLGAANASNFFVWVDYDGTSRHLWMYMARSDDGVPSPKPPSPVLDAPLDLSTVVAEKAYFGFSASTGTQFQLNCLHMWNMTVEVLDDGTSSGGQPPWKLGLIIGVPCGVSALAAGILLACLYIKKGRRRVGDDPESSSSAFKFRKSSLNLMSLAGTPKEFDYTELRKGTEDFAAKNKLGQGGYGVVYRATVAGDSDGESVDVAVKQFSAANTKGQEDFLAELSIINRLRHRNLVRLRGWCHQDGVLLLVYDYMPNGSLDKHLFGGGAAAPVLSWEQRYKIVTGVAAALNYLHHEYDQRVIHRDIKPSNIMLDSAFGSRLGDFGLARALDSDKTSYTEIMGVPGTMGYIAPECFHTGRATRESDVFGLGAVLLEVACGRRVSFGTAAGDGAIGGCSGLLEWVWRLHGAGRILDAVDRKLAGAFDEDDAERLLLLGLACGHPDPGARPDAKAVVQVLARAVAAPAVPPSKPAFMWPALSGTDCDDGGETSSRRSARTASTELTISTYHASSYSSHGCTRTQVTSNCDAMADETKYVSIS
ncbi:probable L-type lectin-domain containing receptor kinase S.5 [Oryza brachyantha]|uniref:probable L-type lectin-domain containing receptor kinase S.5 n=1 Tax=Oryza brachyantha TaxID=4533 RepID=UPI001AD99401|nr:probable L-type lectin-domain containing receptor kinase S.5 [Oryza brachyantha]